MDLTGKEETPNRIPVRFVDDEDVVSQPEATAADDSDPNADTPSAEDIGRESSYEDETEVKRRIDRGAEEDSPEGRDEADDRDVAGGPDVSETPERREDQESTSSRQASSAPSEDSRSSRPFQPGDQSAGPMVAELIATRAELKRVEAENVELRDNLARRLADFDNFRKRVERERIETYNRALSDVVTKLLPVMDNLRRALEAETLLEADKSEEFRHFLNGVELISRQLTESLSNLGLEPIESVGKPFDPHLHEAVATEYSEEYEPDTVLQELARGYRLGDKLVRPAVVKVATR
jgi:molecular chaperone GrpE